MHSILWNPLPTTYTEHLGLLCQIVSDKGKIHRIKDYYLLKNNLQRHLLIKNIYSSKSVWVRIERMVGFAEVSVYKSLSYGNVWKNKVFLCRIIRYIRG